MVLSNYLPWQLSVLLLTLSCIVCISYSVKYWRSGYKIVAVSFFGFSILAAQMVLGYLRGSGYNGDYNKRFQN
ncbi:hypothetical protein DesyoDRAFT_3065 [Desulfosporosinus youngiae DSM 17734]|uniref:Uncharacterized protein n=1 Tax=Desulfosporosinus youngiae DSM 17734 TaxID=768710 RepID=H5XVM5_9FIRM|nr:hypothetical protein DesyoDRAFT_3065 [Desulfosporosinus youngiae DSM 17734]